MKYKYIVGLLVALSLNNAFAADEAIDLYQNVYGALTTRTASPTDRINAALENNEDYDNKKDSVLWRSILAGFQLRKAVFELNATELQTIVEAHNAFFKTSLGMSLVYGWTLKHFAAPELPYYIVGNFSFGQHFNLIADQFTTEQTKTFLKSTFTLGLAAVDGDEDTKWEFYSDAISALCVVESIGSRDGDLSMDGIIDGSYLTNEKKRTESLRVPGRADHLWIETSFDTEEYNLKDHDDDATALVSLQLLIIQKPELFKTLDTPSNLALEILVSLPANTPRNYEFLGYALNDGDDSHYYFLKTVAVRESRRLTPDYFENRRRHVINRISKEINTEQGFKKLELLKDALWITNNPSFLNGFDAFPYYMVTKDVNNGLDTKLVQILAKYTRENNPNFMQGQQQAYSAVTSYADTQCLRGTLFSYQAVRAPILEVLAALKAEYEKTALTIADMRSDSVWRTVAGDGD